MRLAYLSLLLMLSACSTESRTPFVDLCAKTVKDYGPLRDEGPAEAYADLFTVDGEFHLGPNVTQGRDALIARHKAANTASVWRHNMTDIRIIDSEAGLSGNTRFHIFTGPKGGKPSAPSREIIGDYHDEFVIEEGGCKIKTRKVKIVFDSLN
ncbi:MAG: hypothetical protein EX271_09360 [Acidimicrobiales bacterium]|nr:SnoaL-like domain-containing protein [Hyphomonadaceae bacterium]RZV40842.1 MAG: hypothetical protein EX271_09360 [Acidimicrobiales bacterium]